MNENLRPPLSPYDTVTAESSSSNRPSSSTPSASSGASSSKACEEPASPSEYQPLLPPHSSMSSRSTQVDPQAYASPSQRNFESGSHHWSDGMKGLLTSLTGAPTSKSRTPVPTMAKADEFEPVRASEVEAATSIWNAPRDTVAMTMGYGDNYDNPNFQSSVWPPSQVHGYAGQNNNHAQHDNHFASSSYNPPTPSGLTGEASRPRPSNDAALADRTRRPMYPNTRPLSVGEAPEASHPAPWWTSDQGHAPQLDESAHPHYASRRLNPPPLPEARSRQGWNGPPGLEMGSYEFPQNSLGKREYEEEAFENPTHGIADPNDAASRRYSMAPGMSFAKPSAPISGMMNSYRPSFPNDPRRPSLPTDFSGMPQQQASRGPYGGNPSQWSPWASSPTYPSGMGMAASGSSPQTWRDSGVRYSGIESTSPSGMPGSTNKKHQRGRSSSAASALQQASTLANTPFHITTEIVLRALPGSKMEDVYYDQHCEVQTGMPDPPGSDFELENEEDRPRLQTDKLRFPGDLYTPRWVRGSGNAREAWCDRCENGNWLQLKNSQYWYDQVHKHGVSSVSGLRFTAPTHLKVYSDAAGTIEGKCHHCKEWVLICTAKRRRNFSAFFKHAHACHSYRKASAVGNGPIVEHNPGGYRNKKE